MSDIAVVGEDGQTYYMDGEDVMGVVGDILGAGGGRGRRRKGRRRARRADVEVESPNWRDDQLGPGVNRPGEGLMPLPLQPLANGGVFDATTGSIIFQGQLQKPFRGERVLTRVTRTGATATGTLLTQLFVGTDLQQADVQGFDIESIGEQTAFGVRLAMSQAQPGVLIRFIVNISTIPQAADTVRLDLQLLGRIVH